MSNNVGLFMVFGYHDHYPSGGFNDFLGLALTKEQAYGIFLSDDNGYENYQIVDSKTYKIVESGERHVAQAELDHYALEL